MVERSQACERALEGGTVDARAGGLAVDEIVDRLDVDIEHVQGGAIRRAVRTRRVRSGGKQCVQRIGADEVGACGGRDADGVAQVGEVADAPVAMRAQRVKLQRQSPDPGAAGEQRRAVATRRRDDQRRRCKLRACSPGRESSACDIRWPAAAGSRTCSDRRRLPPRPARQRLPGFRRFPDRSASRLRKAERSTASSCSAIRPARSSTTMAGAGSPLAPASESAPEASLAAAATSIPIARSSASLVSSGVCREAPHASS